MRDGDALLIVWVLVTCIWDVLVWGFFLDLVFWRGHSGLWFIFACALTYSPSILNALKKRFDVDDTP